MSHDMISISLDGQDTRFSPWRPGFDSRMEKYFIAEAMAQLVARRIPDPKAGGSTPSSFTATEIKFLFYPVDIYIFTAVKLHFPVQ